MNKIKSIIRKLKIQILYFSSSLSISNVYIRFNYIQNVDNEVFFFKGMTCFFTKDGGLRCDPSNDEMNLFRKLQDNKKLEKYSVRLS